jgi:hypothetical protein
MSRQSKLSTLRRTADGTKIIFDNFAQASSFDYIQAQLGMEAGPAQQLGLTCRAVGGIQPGAAVKLVGIDVDGIPLVSMPAKGESALIWGVNPWVSDSEFFTFADGDEGTIIINGFVRKAKVTGSPASYLGVETGDSIYPYSGGEKTFTGYDTIGLFCGTVLKKHNGSYSDILFRSPALQIGLTTDGIVNTRTTRVPVYGTGIAHGNLLKLSGSIYDSAGENLPRVDKWVQGTDADDELFGIAPSYGIGRLATVLAGQVAVPVNGSPAIGLPVYTEAGTSSFTTVATTGNKVGTIINSSGAFWVVFLRL